ncbi:hypothetical protein [Falsibacillus pallidus]|uniref:hypothetical protein n=1 Tax=Falsibacillus pallidus TaxID=493781 RepID=UPI003D97CF1F
MLFHERLLKNKIGMPKACLHLDNDVYSKGGCINGKLEVKGGSAKKKIKRYDIDLISIDQFQKKEETINSRSVFCSHNCSPNKTGTFSFVLNIPENIEKAAETKKFCVLIRVVLENAHSIIQKYPIHINQLVD